MKRNSILLYLFCLALQPAIAQLNGKIKIYFNHAVNTSVSSGINAVYLNNSMDDTLVAYIDRAKYTLDIAVYNYQQSTGMADIATAVNNAENRGVKVRWIYDGSQSNSGMSALNTTIQRLGSPTTSAYGIMHNKFMLVDARSSNTNDPLVWTGSTNWSKTHFNASVNNSVIIQDSDLAQAYLSEFNEMWGDTGLIPNLSNSKFGPFKADNTVHTFNIGGSVVELYFSPTDSTNSHVVGVMKSANTDLYFGMLSFSSTTNSNAIINRKNSGVYVAGIIDQTSQFYAPYASLSSSLGADLKMYSQITSVYHNKILLADPCNVSSDPTVITGSYNWTTPAETQNDENALFIHNDTVANIFYQSFYQNFSDLSGTLMACSNSLPEIAANKFEIYPTLNNGNFMVSWEKAAFAEINLAIYNSFGQKMADLVCNSLPASRSYFVRDLNLPGGLYFVRIRSGYLDTVRKIVIEN